ncbi:MULTISPECIES: DUF1002 domain-containing protein [Methanobrevibacter]|uniref:Uncharacterized protein YpuA (DUF1002 family) n=1 Tax=Methanobrevibacter gottschalkii DSM 11977 TaxID=1122229 RepID=A0A3N5BQ09_9EURY|nr:MULTISPECIES: DUF1002 domain-containing protein [Methanobrevibacter]OEC94545.1 hypothetical protein A9505_08440 [Methanobrevibacter sp. A27]RPF51848.1 uncharacterized protein YpuA (DUF1002 family) [Methanobrevibacter gottschalkii DSM 11977]
MRKISILVLLLILVGMLIPTGFATDSNVVITYGETTYSNSNYKSFVDNFFVNQANVDINNVGVKTITADQVNQVSSGITGKSYNSNQILSSALVDLNDNGNLKVSVDKSKITTITGDMYISALKSAGITSGHVYVTSPVQATGESALAGIMNSYEEVTDVQIPDSVKEAANDEIYTQAEIVNNSGVNADDLSNLVNQVKDEVSGGNVTNHDEIVNIINSHVENNNINITNNDIENLADSIEQVQNVQGDVNYYKTQVNEFLDDNSTGGFSLDGLFDWIKSFTDGI